MSDWSASPEIRHKLTSGTEYRGTKNVPIGEETYKLPYRLLSAEEQLRLQSKIDMASLAEAAGDADDEDDEIVQQAEQTVQRLQDKDELSEDDEKELRDAQTTLVQNKGELIDAMGESTLMAFHEAGRMAISPDEEDVAAVMDASTMEKKDRFNDIDGAPNVGTGTFTREDAKDALEAEMHALIDNSPFLVYFTIGQSVWQESRSAGKLVDGSEQES